MGGTKPPNLHKSSVNHVIFYRLVYEFLIFKARALSSSKRKNIISFLRWWQGLPGTLRVDIRMKRRCAPGWTAHDGAWGANTVATIRRFLWDGVKAATWRIIPGLGSVVTNHGDRCCHRFHIGLLDSKMAELHGFTTYPSPGSPSNPSTNPLGESPSSVGERWAFGAYLSGFGACLGATPGYGFYQSHLSQRSPVSVLMSFEADFPANVLPGTLFRDLRHLVIFALFHILYKQGDFLQNGKVVIRKIRKLRVWGWAWTFYPLKIKAVLALSREWGNEALYGYKGDSFPHSLLRACQFFMCDFIYYIYYSF